MTSSSSRESLSIWLAAATGCGAVAATVASSFGWLTIPDGVGDLLGGSAALMGTLLAWAGFTRWETQQRKTREAETAGYALIAALDMAERLRRVARREHGYEPSISSQVTPNEELEAFQGILAADPARSRFDEARIKVEAFLPEAHACMEGLATLIADVEGALEWALCFDFRDSSSYAIEAWKHCSACIGDEMIGRIDQAASQLKDDLRPYALVA